MRRPVSRHGSGKCVGVGVPDIRLDAETARRLRDKREKRLADPKLMAEWRTHCALMSAKQHSAKRPVTLAKLNWLEKDALDD